ncbi:MAG: ATP synthase F0 subunit B [Bryobacteraceae bacterium]
MKRHAVLILTAVLLAGAGLAQHAPQPTEPRGGAAEEHQAGPGTDRTTLWKTANFILLAALLGYFGYKRGGAFLAARSAGVRRSLEEAAQLKQEAEARCAEIERRLASLAQEIEELRGRARQESEAEGERLRRESQRTSEKIQAQAEQEIAAAGKAARQELRAYAAGLAVDLAARKIRDRLTPDSEQALVQATLRDLGRRPAAQAERPH